MYNSSGCPIVLGGGLPEDIPLEANAIQAEARYPQYTGIQCVYALIK